MSPSPLRTTFSPFHSTPVYNKSLVELALAGYTLAQEEEYFSSVARYIWNEQYKIQMGKGR